MKFFKYNYILIIIFLIIFGVILSKFLGILSFADQSLNFEGKSKQEKMYPNSPIIQKIKSEKDNFSQINISVNKFSPGIRDKITLGIYDESCGQIIAKSEINIISWDSPGYKKIRFSPISDSGGKTYCLKLNYIASHPESKEKPYISSYTSEGTSYVNTGKSIEEQKNRTLKLKPAYKNGSVWKNFSTLIGRMSQYKPDYFKGAFLEILSVSSLILIILFTIII